MLQSLADSSSSTIERRLAAVSERLREIERRKTAVDDRQDDIDRLAFDTIATMVDMQVQKLEIGNFLFLFIAKCRGFTVRIMSTGQSVYCSRGFLQNLNVEPIGGLTH